MSGHLCTSQGNSCNRCCPCYNVMRQTISVFRFTIHFLEHVFSDMRCMACQNVVSGKTAPSKKAELGGNCLSVVTPWTVWQADSSVQSSKQLFR